VASSSILTIFKIKNKVQSAVLYDGRPVVGVRLSPLGTVATTGLLYQPQVIDDGDCGVIGGIKVGR
jgi:hypothetical protein